LQSLKLSHAFTISLPYPLPLSIIILHPIFTFLIFFFFNDPATTEIYTLSLHDALPISQCSLSLRSTQPAPHANAPRFAHRCQERSEEHTSELQSRGHLVCRLLLEKKKKHRDNSMSSITRMISASVIVALDVCIVSFNP